MGDRKGLLLLAWLEKGRARFAATKSPHVDAGSMVAFPF
jgi:hypothetical protein